MDRLRFLASLVLVGLAGCRSDVPPEGVPLATLAAEAEPWRETREIDLGGDAPEPLLVSGWAAPSIATSGYLWGGGDGSELDFFRADPRAFRIQLRGWAHPRLPGGQEAIVALNDALLGSVRVGAKPTVAVVDVPAGVARPGRNRLTLRYPVTVETGRYGRRFGPAWDAVRFDAVDEPALPSVDGDGAIVLPAGSGLEFFSEDSGEPADAERELRFDAVETVGEARLAVDESCTPGAARFDLPAKRRWTGELRYELAPELRSMLCRLTLRAAAGRAGAGGGLVRLRGARIARNRGAGAPSALATNEPATAPRPSFVLYVVDALRADRLGPYGAPRPATPALDAFAARATTFERARAQSSWTRPAMATLFTGATPLRHGTNGLESRLPEALPTIGERLRALGYRTAYVTANGNTAPAFGFDRGFDAYLWLAGAAEDEKIAWREVQAAALAALDGFPRDAPFLLVVHTVETHAPYRPAPPHRARWAPDADATLGERPVLVTLPARMPDATLARQVSELYDAEVASSDEGFGVFLAELERRGRLRGTSVLFLSDHGEELFDHGGVEHGRNLFEEQLRIPLVWSLPSPAGSTAETARRVPTPIDQVDVLPTILDLAGAPADPQLAGRSFATALRGGAPPEPRASPAWLDRLTFRQESIVDGDWKLLNELAPRARALVAEPALYDLAADPGEQAPMPPAAEPLRAGLLRGRQRGWVVRSGLPLDGAAVALDAKLREELRALGYLD